MADGYVWFEGIAFPVLDFKPEVLREVRDKFVVKDEDVITLTYPKSGTNWLMEIVCLIHSKGDPKWVQSVPNWQRAPWVETAHGYEILQNSEGPRIFTSHLPIQLFPKSFFHSKAKVIYGMRNPRDVFVSSYFFMQKLNVAKKPETQQQYLEWFLQGNDIGSLPSLIPGVSSAYFAVIVVWIGNGTNAVTPTMDQVIYGSWFEHIRGWLSRRQCENFLVVSYEELTKDTRSVVEKICQFLGKELKPEEIDLVLKYSSFEFMKENKMSNFSTLPDMFLNEGFSLQRKGVTGDWKNHFTVAQAEVFDEVYQQNMAGFPPKLFPWE